MDNHSNYRVMSWMISFFYVVISSLLNMVLTVSHSTCRSASMEDPWIELEISLTIHVHFGS
jgi:hypothetical protein